MPATEPGLSTDSYNMAPAHVRSALIASPDNGVVVAERPRKFVLRLPAELHRRVTEAAGQYRRSMNSEIVTRLEYALNGISADADAAAVEPALFPYLETTFRGELSEEENALIRLFRRLSTSQRKALTDLLGG